MANFLRRRDWSKRLGKRAARQSPGLRTEALEPRYALSATPLGDAFLVNDFVRGDQSIDESTLAVAASPVNRVVVYEGRGAEPGAVDFDGVYGRVYGLDGQPLGDSFLVNTTTRGEQHSPSVAVEEDGSFVVVWAGRGQLDRDGIYLQRFDNQGQKIDGEILVNSTLGGEQTAPSVAVGDNGIYVVAWQGAGVGDVEGIFFRRFTDQGSVSDFEARVNTTVVGEQSGASIAVLDGDEFVIGWQSRRQDGSDWGVYSQSFNSTALRLGNETQLNTTTAASQTEVAVAANPLGGYVAAWQSRDQDGDGWGVIGRTFGTALDGSGDGAEVVLNAATAGQQTDPAIAVAADGQWVTAWTSAVADGSGLEVLTRTFDADGTANAPAIVHTATSGVGSENQRSAAIALNAETAWIAWSGAGASDREGVYAQRYDLIVDPGEPQVAPRMDNIADQAVEVGSELSVTVRATDENADDVLTYTLDPDDAPDGAVITRIDNNTARITWTPDADDDNQTFVFRVLVIDDDPTSPLADVEQFSVTVGDIPLALDLNGEADGTTSSRDFIVGDQTSTGGTAVRSLISEVDVQGAATLSGATATLTNPTDLTTETLSAVVPAASPITADYDNTTGVLTLEGVATADQYEAVLRTIVYNNSGDNPAGERTVEISVTEQGGATVTQDATVRIVNPDLVAFAQALTAANARLQGSSGNELTTRQLELFDDGQNELLYTENASATAPIWTFDDGTQLAGFQTLAVLSAASGVAIPQAAADTAPFLAEIADETLLVGSPLHVALDGYDATGGELTYTVESDNDAVNVRILQNNRSARFDVEGYGDLVFELFEQRTPGATANLIDLAMSDFYQGSDFHRAVDGFVIQGGISGAGTPSPLGNYDDEFDAELQHNRTGLLSAAKTTDDTNNSQFFVTEGPTRNLDFNHTIFGLLVEGEANREAISGVPVVRNLPTTDPRFDDGPVTGDRPVDRVTINEVTIFEDTENAVLFLEADPGATGSANITVTVEDQDGNTSQRTFQVNLANDTSNSRPFLAPIGDQTSPANTPAVFTLASTDVEGNPVTYAAGILSSATVNPADFTVAVSNSGATAGQVTITPPSDFVGTLAVSVSVHAGTPTTDGDFQVIEVEFTANV